ncbi:MAG: porin [Thermoanaerobaculia bacterium]
MIRRRLVALTLTFAVATGAAAAQQDSPFVEERLRKLEEGFEQLRQLNEILRVENEQLRKQLELAASTKEQHAVKPAGKEPKLQIGGMLQVQGEAGDTVAGRFPDDNDRIYVRRARVTTSGSFTERVDFRLEGEFAGTSGNSSSMRAQLTDGYVTFTHWPTASIRVGQFKTPFGFEQLYSDTRLAVPERSVPNDLLTIGRQLGLQIAGDLAGKRVSYAVGAFNGNSANTSFNDNDEFLVAGRISTLVAGDATGPMNLHLGINSFQSDDGSVSLPAGLGFDSTPGSQAHDNVFRGNRTGFGIDAQLVAGRSELWAEYLATDFEPSDGIPFDDFRASGWYAQATYFAIPDKLQFVGKYESTDPSDEATGDDGDVLWLGTNYFLRSHDIKLQLFYATDDGDGDGRIVARVQTLF